MKTDTHPDYLPVVFRDLASGATFLTRSTVTSQKTIEWEDGNTYPVIDVEISSESAPVSTRVSSASSTPPAVSRSSTAATRASASSSSCGGVGPSARPLHPCVRRATPVGRLFCVPAAS